MKRSMMLETRPLLTLSASLAAALVLAFQPAMADDPAADETSGASAPGVSANLYFTDENGNRREPTAAEIRAAAEAFQRDLARLAGQHRGKHYERTLPDGTVAATIAPSKLVFLTVHQNEDGELVYGHSVMDEDGKVAFEPVNPLPEK
jgi:hypothetical protein